MLRNLLYSCRVCKSFLEEGNFIYALNKHDGTTFLLCHGCKKDLDRVTDGKLPEEEFKKSIKKRWEQEKRKTDQKIEEAKKQGLKVETIKHKGSKEPTCCQLREWFNELEEEEKESQHSSFLVIFNNLEKKDRLCFDCLKFRNNL